MNKLLIFSICTLLVLLTPVFATDTNSGVDLQQIQNSQDIYDIINSWFTGILQDFSSQINIGNIQTQLDNFINTSNIQSTLNSTIQNIMSRANLNDISNNPDLQNVINSLKGYTNQN